MIDIVDATVTVTDIDKRFQHIKYVFFVENTVALGRIATDAAIEFHPSHGREVVPIGVEKQVGKQILGGLLGWRLARAHHAIDFDQCLEPSRRWIDIECVRNKRAAVEFVYVERTNMLDPRIDQRLHQLRREFGVRRREQFAGFSIDDVVGQDLALEVLGGDRQLVD